MTTIDDTTTVEDLIAPIEAYLARAANRPIDTPVDHLFAELEARVAASEPRALAMAITTTFFCDFSEFQPYVNSTYPYAVASFRLDSGWRTDLKAAGNWKYLKGASKVQIVIGYVVCIPGQLDAVMARVKKLLGNTCPAKVAFMVDMESGAGFAGPGNHSAEGNRWLAAFAAYAKTKKRVLAYANGYDFAQCWPQLATGYKTITASYGTRDPGSWGWQYAGGDPRWTSSVGYPRAAQPFGSWVDFNVVHRTLAQMKTDLGIAVPAPPKPTPTPAPKYKTYKVRSGDSLSGIAAKFRVVGGWHQLVTWNKTKYPTLVHNPNTIHIGWVLRVSK